MQGKSQQVREQQARLRAELIVQVQSGVMTAAEAARRLGVSRKTYYQWERRALQAMVGSLVSKAGGRPATPVDEEKERLRQQVQALRRELLLKQQSEAIRELLERDSRQSDPKERSGTERAKKKEPNPPGDC